MNQVDNFKYISKLKLSYNSIIIYKDIKEDTVFKKLDNVLKLLSTDEICLESYIDAYCDFYHSLLSINPNACLKEYIVDKIIFDNNPFTKESEISNGNISKTLLYSATRDLLHLETLSGLDSTMLHSYVVHKTNDNELTSFLYNLPNINLDFESQSQIPHHNSYVNEIKSSFLNNSGWNNFVTNLVELHRNYGRGIFLKYYAFTWTKEHTTNIKGIENPDGVKLSDLIGYEDERSLIIENTTNFLNGYPSNNVLLYGDRGTGKSTTVKAILNEYKHLGLIAIEVPKNHLIDFPNIINVLKNHRQKFIIFVDDLAFEDNEENYTALKAALEGCLESRANNVLIYATSNRRHLIKQKFSDRKGLMSDDPNEEINASDTIQEKLSLKDRFGITIVYTSPNKNQYLKIVEGMALIKGLDIDMEYLHKEALKWELWYNGRSPRTARQFIDWISCKTK